MKHSTLRRAASISLTASLAAAIALATPTTAQAVVAIPPAPAFGHLLQVFVDSDAVIGVSDPNASVTVDVLRAGTLVATTTVTTDPGGNFQINHPAPPNQFCWDSNPGQTVDIAAGDIVEMTNTATGVTEGTQVQNVSVTPQTNAGSGNVTVSGVVADPTGAALAPAFVEGRLQLKGGQHFQQTGTNQDRAGGAAPSSGASMTIDPATGNYTATYHFSNANDIPLAMNAVDIMSWLGRDATGLTELTSAEEIGRASCRERV